jgi:hypothetical protein
MTLFEVQGERDISSYAALTVGHLHHPAFFQGHTCQSCTVGKVHDCDWII